MQVIEFMHVYAAKLVINLWFTSVKMLRDDFASACYIMIS